MAIATKSLISECDRRTFRFDSLALCQSFWCVTVLSSSVRRYKKKTPIYPFAENTEKNLFQIFCLSTDFSSTVFSGRPNDARQPRHVNVNAMQCFQFSFGFRWCVAASAAVFTLTHNAFPFPFFSLAPSSVFLLRFRYVVRMIIIFVSLKNRHRHTGTHSLTLSFICSTSE